MTTYESPRLMRARGRALDSIGSAMGIRRRWFLERLPWLGSWLYRRRLGLWIRRWPHGLPLLRG
jgi:hypothetical protein